MVRTFSLVSVLAALAIGGYLMTAQGKSQGPSSPQVSTAIDQAQTGAAAINFQQASARWSRDRSCGTAPMRAPTFGGYGVVLVRADAASYCIQTPVAPPFHETGPGGVPAAGAC